MNLELRKSGRASFVPEFQIGFLGVKCVNMCVNMGTSINKYFMLMYIS
jgi:hypothetical protein